MQTIVRLMDNGCVTFDNAVNYEIGEEGDLDILDANNVCLSTFARGCWKRVYRVLEDEEEWPAELLKNRPDNEVGVYPFVKLTSMDESEQLPLLGV